MRVRDDISCLFSHSSLCLTVCIARLVRLPTDFYTPSNSLFNGSTSAENFGSAFRIQFSAHINFCKSAAVREFFILTRASKFLESYCTPSIEIMRPKNDPNWHLFRLMFSPCSLHASGKFQHFEAAPPR